MYLQINAMPSTAPAFPVGLVPYSWTRCRGAYLTLRHISDRRVTCIRHSCIVVVTARWPHALGGSGEAQVSTEAPSQYRSDVIFGLTIPYSGAVLCLALP